MLYLDRLARRYGPESSAPVPGLGGKATWRIDVPLVEAQRLAALANTSLPPDAPGPKQPIVDKVSIFYSNDGKDPFPNVGGGADHGLTTRVRVAKSFANTGRGWTEAGSNLEIWTPTKGGPPRQLPGYEPGVYPGRPGKDAGGFKAPVFVDFAYRIAGGVEQDLTILTKLGGNDTHLGEALQNDLVHRQLKLALFDWTHERREFYGALGLRGSTIHDFVEDRSLDQANFRVRLTLSSQALIGTHESEAGVAAQLSVKTGYVRLLGPTKGELEVRLGADGRGLARYNDQAPGRSGAEVGATIEYRLNLRQIDIPFVPAFDASLIVGGRAQQSSLEEGRAGPGEDGPSLTAAWLGPGSKAEGWVGLEIPLR